MGELVKRLAVRAAIVVIIGVVGGLLWAVTEFALVEGLAALGESTTSRPASLTIYTGRDKEAVARVVDLFTAHHPEYKGRVTVVTLGAQAALDRLRAERTNPQADFLWGGTVHGLRQAADEGLLAATTPTHAKLIDPSRRDPLGRWHGEMLLPEVIVYNDELLKAGQAPKDWDDLLSPRFRDQIVIRDVMASGTMRTIFSAMIYRQYARTGSPAAGYDWLRHLDANTVVYAANPEDMYLKLDRGVGTVTLWNLQDALLQRGRYHRPWSYVIPASGVPVLLDGVAVVKKPNGDDRAGRAFQDFLLQPSVQAMLSSEFYQIPAMQLSAADMPRWLSELHFTAMAIDEDLVRTQQGTWMDYWSQNVKGRGLR